MCSTRVSTVYFLDVVFCRDPSEVMLCVLPDVVTGDVSLHIHVTLLEAFCFENEIRILKIDHPHKLQLALARDNVYKQTAATAAAGYDVSVTTDTQYSEEDFNCLLVEVGNRCRIS